MSPQLPETDNDAADYEASFQTLLDEQWDALEARDPRAVKRVRRAISTQLNDLASRREANCSTLGKWIAKERTVNQKHQDIKQHLDKEKKGPLALEILATSTAIREAEIQLAVLERRRNELVRHKRDVESVLASRDAHWQELLADLPSAVAPDDMGHFEAKLEASQRELQAARGGGMLWLQVCSELNELDSDLAMVAGIDQVPFMLAQRISVLESFLEIAQDNGWSMLVVAIGHEVQILHEALNAVQQSALEE